MNMKWLFLTKPEDKHGTAVVQRLIHPWILQDILGPLNRPRVMLLYNIALINRLPVTVEVVTITININSSLQSAQRGGGGGGGGGHFHIGLHKICRFSGYHF